MWWLLVAFAAEPAPAEAPDTASPETEAPDGAESPEATDAPEPAEAPDPTPPPPAPAPAVELTDEERADVAESRRLRQELVKAAGLSRHDAVDRLYRQLVVLGQPIPDDIHVYGADAARALGDMMHCVARLHRGQGGPELSDVEQRFGTVRLSVAAPGAKVEGAERFAPDEAKAVAWVNEHLAEDGRFVGMLPAGEYELGGRALVVPAGGAVSVVVD